MNKLVHHVDFLPAALLLVLTAGILLTDPSFDVLFSYGAVVSVSFFALSDYRRNARRQSAKRVY